jgi:hypothetical protein
MGGTQKSTIFYQNPTTPRAWHKPWSTLSAACLALPRLYIYTPGALVLTSSPERLSAAYQSWMSWVGMNSFEATTSVSSTVLSWLRLSSFNCSAYFGLVGYEMALLIMEKYEIPNDMYNRFAGLASQIRPQLAYPHFTKSWPRAYPDDGGIPTTCQLKICTHSWRRLRLSRENGNRAHGSTMRRARGIRFVWTPTARQLFDGVATRERWQRKSAFGCSCWLLIHPTWKTTTIPPWCLSKTIKWR